MIASSGFLSPEEKARARLQFIAKVSHELRAPLQSITGYVELLRLGLPDPPTRQQRILLERVCAAERVLLGIVNDLSGLTRSEIGQLAYHVRPVDAAVLIDDTDVVVAPLAQEMQVRLARRSAPAGLRVSADRRRAVQVLVNLLTNAMKFSRPGGEVRLECRRDERDAHFDVSDDGPGIPSEKMGTIFEPYVQLGTGIHPRAPKGLGLGLAIARELADGMGGSVTAASTAGKGSTFTLTLPVADA